MTVITQILFDRTRDNQKLIKRNTELIEKLLDRIIEIRKTYTGTIEMTTQKELRKLGLSRRDARAIRHTAEMYAKEAYRENDRAQPGWRKALKKEQEKYK